MAKLWFRYGAMGSSKTAMALMVAFNYEEKGLRPLVMKPKIENRDGKTIIKSRIGLSRECLLVEDIIDVNSMENTLANIHGYDSIIVDEVQFCKVEEVRILWKIVHEYNIPVLCYGLLVDFQNNMFETSKELLIIADVHEELKTVCWCGRAAKCNARIDADGNVIKDGEQVVLGGNESYVSLCLEHYYDGNTGTKIKARH